MYWAGPLYCLLCSAPAPPGCHPSLVLRVLLLRVTAKGQGNGYRLQQGKLQPGARKDFTEEAGPQKVCATSVFGGVQTQPGQSSEQPEVSQPWFDQETRVAGPSCHMYPTASCTSLQKQIKFNTSVLVRLVPWDVERKNGKLAPHTSDNVDKSWALYSAPRAGEEPVLMPPDLYRLWMQGKENISVWQHWGHLWRQLDSWLANGSTLERRELNKD